MSLSGHHKTKKTKKAIRCDIVNHKINEFFFFTRRPVAVVTVTTTTVILPTTTTKILKTTIEKIDSEKKFFGPKSRAKIKTFSREFETKMG